MTYNDIKKLYFSIGEVSQVTDLKQYVLRYWETEFPMLKPQKNSAGNRIYKEEDIQLIRLVKHLLYERKYTIQGARELLTQLSQRDELKKALRDIQILDAIIGPQSDESAEKEKESVSAGEKERALLLKIRKALVEIAEILQDEQ
ncbi:MAG TPA: MerR family transcriptional regulator [Candidatus Marinimicrobia bacterium]|nr:MerR family transcriptional regulator [Candidatus Neomarinimicrobiota bacterium]